ncbi:MAG: phosphopantetheine-binding protein [Pseudomonadota bacterium]
MDKTDAIQTVIAIVRDILPDIDPERVTAESVLADLGANSVDRVDVLAMSMEGLNVRVPMMTFAKANTIEDIAVLLLQAR